MINLKILFWVVILASFHALQEIQIEGGKGGWARHLPTFRINIFLTKLLIGKELTGYHIFMLSMFVTIFHGIFLFQPWTPKIELLVWGWLFWYFILEDFLWFVFNKHYGLNKFKKGHIPWHKRWMFRLPISYWTFGVLGGWLLYFGMK